MAVIEPHAELCPGQSLDHDSFRLEFYRPLLPYTPPDKLLNLMGKGAPLNTASGLLLLHAALLAFGNVPALAAHRAQNAALDNLLAKTLQQRILAIRRCAKQPMPYLIYLLYQLRWAKKKPSAIRGLG